MGRSDWMAVAFFALAVLSACFAIFPRRVWEWSNRWQFKNPEKVEPSDRVLAMESIGSTIVAIVLVGYGVWWLVNETPQERRARCEETVAELRDLYAEEDQNLAPVHRRAEELGVEIDADRSGTDSERIWVTDGDDYLGLLNPGLLETRTECVRYARS